MEIIDGNDPLLRELKMESKRSALAFCRARIVWAVVAPRAPVMEYLAPAELKIIFRQAEVRIRRPSVQACLTLYERISARETARHQLGQASVTAAQRACLRELKKHTGIHFHQNFWIGFSNVDLFTNAVCGQVGADGKRPRGLIIEVDGSIHDRELKMRKDQRRLNFFRRLGLMFFSISNHDLRVPTAQIFFQRISDRGAMKRMPCRDRRRLMQRIYVETICAHASRVEMKNLFGFDVDALAMRTMESVNE